MAAIEEIRHSLAHLLALAVLKKFPEAKLGIGPAIDQGFFYDFVLPHPLSESELPELEELMREYISQNLAFTQEEKSLEEVKADFADRQAFKVELAEEFTKEGKPLTLVKSGEFVDLCKGGHVVNTKEIDPEAFKLTKVAGAYWKGSERNQMMTRIYGVAFESKEKLDEHLTQQALAAEFDHRKLGRELELFSFEPIAPGAPFWHPKGMIVVKELEKKWRSAHEAAGYLEISTPILVKKELFHQSGHLKLYKEKMFKVRVEGEDYYLKPMNCPESTYIYRAKTRSYRDLPLRLSEIGLLHRNELSGVLGGLFRVRQITMDDAHIFCREDQIEVEILGVLELIKTFYSEFGFEPRFYLATRPDKALGGKRLWQQSEAALKAALEQAGVEYGEKPKEGAFYGPKIDVHITDALGRDWQLATIQLDRSMPERFDLVYTGEDGKPHQPVMIHRAIFGSFERFIGILLEHYKGKLPVSIAPEQARVVSVAEAWNGVAKARAEKLREAGVRVAVDDSSETFNKKIRNAEVEKVPYILVVGEKEKGGDLVAVRSRDKGDLGQMSISDLMSELRS